MKYLVEKLIQHEVIKDYSSLVFREDFSDAKYVFESPINEAMSEEDLKNELIDDIFKLTLSIRKHTGGVKHISDKDKEPLEIDFKSLEEFYGGKQYTLYILLPSKMEEPNPRKMLQGFYIPIPGRPVATRINRYYSKISAIISKDGCKKAIEERVVNKVLAETKLYGIENIKSFDYYVYEYMECQENRYYITMVFNFKDEDNILKNRKKNRAIAAELKKQEEERKREAEQRRKAEQEQYEKDREKYLKDKNEYLSQFSGPESYYAEKNWIRMYGDPRFEDPGTLRRSHYTGD